MVMVAQLHAPHAIASTRSHSLVVLLVAIMGPRNVNKRCTMQRIHGRRATQAFLFSPAVVANQPGTPAFVRLQQYAVAAARKATLCSWIDSSQEDRRTNRRGMANMMHTKGSSPGDGSDEWAPMSCVRARSCQTEYKKLITRIRQMRFLPWYSLFVPFRADLSPVYMICTADRSCCRVRTEWSE